MQEVLEQVVGLIRHVWRGRWLALAIAWLVCLIGWAVVSMIPDKYESHARVYVDTEGFPGALLPGGFTQTNTDARLTLLRQTMLSAANVARVVESVGLVGTDNAGIDAASALAGEIREQTKIEVEDRNFFLIDYTDRDPYRAQKVVAGLLDTAANPEVGGDAEQLRETTEFLDGQIETARAQLDAAESRLTDFQEQNAAHIGGSDRFYSRLQEARTRVQDFRGQLALATAERDELERQVSTTPRSLSPAGPSGRPVGRAAELESLRERLAELQSRFTPQHPDVTSTRRAIERLETDMRDNPSPREQGPSNPAYERLRLQLAQAGANVARARSSLEQAEIRAEELAAEVDVAPRAEAEYRRLNSDVELAKRNYTQLTQQRDQARIAGEFGARGNRIEIDIIDPPSLPDQPSSPNRLMLLGAVLVIGLGIGAAVALLIGLVNSPFDSPRSLQDTFDLRVLGSISRLRRQHDRRSAIAGSTGFILACGLLILAFGFLVFAERSQIMQPLRSDDTSTRQESPLA
ncbi:MAG: GNVR domain-containing protein [Geminicoccaceae bacterium]